MQRFLAGLVVALAIVLIGYISLFSIWTNTNEFDSYALTGRLADELEYLTGTNDHRFLEAEDAARAGGWQSNQKPTLNLGNRSEGAWVRFRVENRSPEPLERLLMVDWSYHLIEARVFDRANGQWSAPVHTGNFIEHSQRGIASPVLALPITLPSGPAEVYLRLESQLPLILPMRMVDRETFHREALYDYLRMGAFFGAMLVMMLYSASLFIFIRDRSYIYYCCYLAAIILYVGSIYSYGSYFLWSEWPWFNLRVDFLSIGLAFLSACVFERQFLNIKSEGRWLERCINMIIFYWSSVVLVSLLFPQYAYELFIEEAGALTCIVMLGIAFIIWQRGNVSAGYFFIAWLCLVTSTFFLMLAMSGVLSMNFAIRAAQLLGFILEFLLLSIALAERISRERASRMEAQKALLVVQEQNTKVLEKKVALRTRQLEEANRELLHLSTTDPLTGLNNRRGFEEKFDEALELSLEKSVPLAFLMIDIDHFKAINDTHGHNVGDECLALVGKTLVHYCQGDNAFAGRLGGEEFATVFYGLSSERAEAMAERIRTAIAELIVATTGEPIWFTVSIGVATGLAHLDDTLPTFAEEADKSLYQAKLQGRNRVVLSVRQEREERLRPISSTLFDDNPMLPAK
ncbi:diguanylate cyclase [Halomonas sp. GD1P12]|uniref:sensor domain-containing diguanylate cyclase n=1 Tax=Halomonas sp. GD1P12 TaxID=2982691 RepID=UPI0021E514EC|nr:diguanylate cyclase [Halomonas sp. GD1P12]UYG00283.1 sensor domain-containing diguanylate cyclase [Halomonas sp. GD1P12]